MFRLLVIPFIIKLYTQTDIFKSTFNPKGKDATLELYLSRLKEEIMAIDTKLSYSNLTKEELRHLIR